MSDTDALGDRMKTYENLGVGPRLMSQLPVLARIDGRAFHSFVRGLDRPFDARLSKIMVEVTKELVKETGALIGYTQSDEISLCWHSTDRRSQIYFDGRTTKMVSQLSAQATIRFYRKCLNLLPDVYADRLPTFDSRVWAVPTRQEAVNYFIWRERDATKNSISMAAQAIRKPGESLDGLHGGQLQEFMFQRGINWNDYPSFFKRGTYVQRMRVSRAYTQEQIDKLPANHTARTTPRPVYVRQVVAELSMPPFGATESVIFAEGP